MSLADRAIAAYEANEQTKAADEEAERMRSREVAVNKLSERTEALGISANWDELVESWGPSWSLEVPVTDDLTLDMCCRMARRIVDGASAIVLSGVSVTPKVAEQLYWDLPPGVLKKQPGVGGTYGCYGLDSAFREADIKTLAELGEAIVRVRKARAKWENKHGIS